MRGRRVQWGFGGGWGARDRICRLRHAGSVVQVKRVYDEPAPTDGRRVLVDRLWPRGLARDAGAFDEWLPEVAPSTELRRWYGHDPARYGEFAQRYRAELADPSRAQALGQLREYAKAGPLTLLTAARDLPHAHPTVLADVLEEPAHRRD